jgi:hypothetical protein
VSRRRWTQNIHLAALFLLMNNWACHVSTFLMHGIEDTSQWA